MAGQAAVFVDNLVHLRPIDHVVVNRILSQRPKVGLQRKAVIDKGERGGIPHHRVTLTRNQKRKRDIGVVLPEFHCAAAVVEYSALVLP